MLVQPPSPSLMLLVWPNASKLCFLLLCILSSNAWEDLRSGKETVETCLQWTPQSSAPLSPSLFERFKSPGEMKNWVLRLIAKQRTTSDQFEDSMKDLAVRLGECEKKLKEKYGADAISELGNIFVMELDQMEESDEKQLYAGFAADRKDAAGSTAGPEEDRRSPNPSSHGGRDSRLFSARLTSFTISGPGWSLTGEPLVAEEGALENDERSGLFTVVSFPELPLPRFYEREDLLLSLGNPLLVRREEYAPTFETGASIFRAHSSGGAITADASPFSPSAGSSHESPQRGQGQDDQNDQNSENDRTPRRRRWRNRLGVRPRDSSRNPSEQTPSRLRSFFSSNQRTGDSA